MSNNKKILTVFGIHTLNNQRYHSTLNNIKYLYKYSDKIVCVDSVECKHFDFKKNISFEYPNIDYYNIENDEKLLDVFKWIYGLSKVNINDYDYVILINDSICISRQIDDFFQMFLSLDLELVGFIDSFDRSYHIQSFIRAFNKEGIKKYISYYNKNKNLINHPIQLILKFEVEITKVFTQIKSLYSIKNFINRSNSIQRIIYKLKYLSKYLIDGEKFFLRSKRHGNLHFNDLYYKYFLYKLDYPIIKLKRINAIFYKSNNTLPSDFCAENYKKINWDLKHLSLEKAKKHFIKNGMIEGRKYKLSQQTSPPDYLINYIEKKEINFLLKNHNE